MTTIQLNSQVTLTELLKGVEQLSTPDLAYFVDRVLAVQAQRSAPHLSLDETKLLFEINQGLSAQEQQLFDELSAKRRAELLTSAEHETLLGLLDKIEQLDVQRIQKLTQLARLRQVPIRELMKQLQLKPR